jgi:hypothetical protein
MSEFKKINIKGIIKLPKYGLAIWQHYINRPDKVLVNNLKKTNNLTALRNHGKFNILAT